MDKTQEDFNKASHVLLDAEVRLNDVTVQSKKIEREIALLVSIEANFEENIRVLKRKRVIVMASEFKKSKLGLDTARVRMAFLRMDRENNRKIEEIAQAAYDKAKLDYEKAYDLLHNPPNNLIVVDFGRKSGQE
jgi:hypothetical protein